MSDADGSERTVVKTYVPRHQKAEWTDHADALGMSQSEFVRSMVQAGRAAFEVPAESDSPDEAATPGDPTGGDTAPESSDSDDGTGAMGSVGEGGADRSDDLADRVLAILRSEGHCGWDDLVDRLTTDLEDRLDDALEELQQRNRVRYSGRHGGYTVVDDGQ